jgi:DNA topoisomerase IB
MPRLRRVDCSEPGIRRIRRGRGFSYADEDGATVDDPDELERIRGLAIPPAWTDVWICAAPNGHLQATGYDDAGRKQYLYHSRWREARDTEKFERMEDFARALPELRERIARDLRRRGPVRPRILGCALGLLDLGLFRIGGERYAEDNGSFGLATLRKQHVRVERDRATFDFPAKSGQRRHQTIADPRIVRVLRELKRRRGGGDELLAYRDGRRWHDVRSDDINEHLKELAGEDYSAKDFRTWNATVLAAVELAVQADGDGGSKAARKRAAKAATKRVAAYLGNTPAVCRSAYIDPRVFDRFDSGDTIRAAVERIARECDPHEFGDRERIEAAVLRLLG